MTIGQCLDHTLDWQATHTNATRAQCADTRANTDDIDRSQADFQSKFQHMKDMFQDIKDMIQEAMDMLDKNAARKAAQKDFKCSCTNTPCTCMENRRDQKDI